VTRETGWQTRSPTFAYDEEAGEFKKQHDVVTVGAHDVEVISVKGGVGATIYHQEAKSWRYTPGSPTRHFAFFSNDKDGKSTHQASELFEWIGGYPGGRFESRQRVRTDGAHAAELFASGDGRYFLAVAELGDRKANTYRRRSVVYSFEPDGAHAWMGPPVLGRDPLRVAQRLGTLGATDFCAFEVGGVTFLAVSNEQDDTRGGDINSTIWALRPAGAPAHSEL
jgi:hypothetical protein